MGLLDDAIREHLELKRRHGADPNEVARQEQEALGPVRRGEEPEAEPAAAAGDAPPVVAQEERPFEEAVVEVGEDPPSGGSVLDDPAGTLPDQEPAAPPPEPPAAEAPLPPATPPSDVSQPTVAFSLDEEEAAQPADPPAPAERPRAAPEPPADATPAEEDELAETPEFLQETPEHDRLWFEQKPPRDFDF